MSISIGQYNLTHGLMLAPMAGVTDTVFRKLCKHYGAEYTVSEMVCAKALCYEQKSKKMTSEGHATAMLARVHNEQMPMAVQIFGNDPSFMAEAASMIENLSYKGCMSECAPVAIDINMGCPVRKIVSNGEGRALMKDPELAGRIVRAVADAVKIPVTVKIRAGWDKNHVNAPEMAKILEQSGASLICVHARTREQQYLPGIDMSVIERVKKGVSVPVVGNGDIYSADDAIKMMESTGCDGVMIGRGAQGAPWIFEEIIARLEGREFVPPSVEQIKQIALAQLEKMIQERGERLGIAEGKKHMAWYINGVRGAAQARANVMTSSSYVEIKKIFDELSKEPQ